MPILFHANHQLQNHAKHVLTTEHSPLDLAPQSALRDAAVEL